MKLGEQFLFGLTCAAFGIGLQYGFFEANEDITTCSYCGLQTKLMKPMHGGV